MWAVKYLWRQVWGEGGGGGEITLSEYGRGLGGGSRFLAGFG